MDVFLLAACLIVLIVFFCFLITSLLREICYSVLIILKFKIPVKIVIGLSNLNNIQIKIALLSLSIEKKHLNWRNGTHYHSEQNLNPNYLKLAFYVGLIFPLLIALFFLFIAFYFNTIGIIKLFAITLIIYVIIDLYNKLLPIDIYTNGYIYKSRYVYSYYRFIINDFLINKVKIATNYYNQKMIREANYALSELIQLGVTSVKIFELSIECNFRLQYFDKAIELLKIFEKNRKMTIDYLLIYGLCYSYTKQHNEALEIYNKILNLNPVNSDALNNMGFTYLQIKKYKEAIEQFDKSILISDLNYYSYANRGLAKIKIGYINYGIDDIHHSFKLNKVNSYAFRSLGIYFQDLGENENALKCFKKSKELDSNTFEIDELISSFS